jgi:3-mercaptopyruvate sulfurtransferase SseA
MLFRKNFFILFVLIFLACVSSTLATTKESQEQPCKTIKTSELKAWWDAKVKDLLLIDTRNPEEFEHVHIPGAVNIPQKKFIEYKHLLPEEKNTRLVFYCNGVK